MTRIAAAPISWGVCEVPGWGVQLDPEVVLGAMQRHGIHGTELGPDGWLAPSDDVAVEVLGTYGLDLAGGFVTAALHDPASLADELAAVERQAHRLASCGAHRMLIAATAGDADYEHHTELGERGWATLLEGLDRVADCARSQGIVAAIHPHVGTLVEQADHVERVLTGSAIALCLDTGHLTIGGADLLALARGHAGRIAHVHLKDVSHDLALRVHAGDIGYADAVADGLYVELGSGDARIDDVVMALESGGYDGWYVLEQDVRLGAAGDADGVAAAVERQVAFVRRLLRERVA